jgi:nucleotide-binding universal stress UspA family protein
MTTRRVLVPLDGSPEAETILPFVLDVAGPLDLELVLVRVMPLIMPHPVEGSTYFNVDDVAARLAEARAYLARVAADLRRRGVRVTIDARHGDPVAEILSAARESGSDMIATTTHGRSGVRRLFFGSIAEAVLRHAEVPVLVMRLTEQNASSAQAA